MHRTRFSLMAAALAGTMTTPLHAQSSSEPSEEIERLRAQVAELGQRIDRLQEQLREAPEDGPKDGPEEGAAPAVPTASRAPAASPPGPRTAIAFKGAPEVKHSSGWSFKPRGRLMYDAGFTSVPGSPSSDEGFGNEVRRARLGVQGDIPGGFGYKFELDFAGDEVEAADAILTYETGDAEIAIGHQNNFQSLEELTSSLHTSFIERAAFTDAFGFERRIGVSASYESGLFLAQAGVFTDNFDDTDTDNRGVDGRFVVMPEFGNAQAHLGASIHYNDLGKPGDAVRYRQRPLVHFTSDRFVNTGTIGAQSELGYGLEAALISGPFHAAAEAFWQRADRPGVLADPTFFGGYAEVGYFLTAGDSRGYKGGKFDRVKPANPLGEGGIGSVQFNLRYDRLDLNDAGIVGGKQDGYYASVIWKPIDYVLFMLNYGHLNYEDAALATAGGDRSYGVDVLGVRAQIDF